MVTLMAWKFLLFVWLIALMIDECRQYYRNPSLHFQVLNNKMDAVILSVFLVVIILRCIAVGQQIKNLNYAAHIILIFNMICSYIRLLGVFSASLIMGPLLFAVIAMLRDILKFIIFVTIFILSFTWAFMAIANENFNDGTWLETYPDGPVLLPVWGIFSEFSSSLAWINQIEVVGPVLLAIYLLFVQILLINLLIAMMNDSYSRVRDNADIEWKFSRFSLILEYEAASALPPPISVLQIFFEIITFIICRRRINTVEEDEEDEVIEQDTANDLNSPTNSNKRLGEGRHKSFKPAVLTKIVNNSLSELDQLILEKLNNKRDDYLEKYNTYETDIHAKLDRLLEKD